MQIFSKRAFSNQMNSFVMLLLPSLFSVFIAFPLQDINMKPVDKFLEFGNNNVQVSDNTKIRKARQVFENINVDILNGLSIFISIYF